MAKIALNSQYGGFNLSHEAIKMLMPLCPEFEFEQDLKFYFEGFWLKPRTDERLISVIEVLGDKASGNYSKIKLFDFPDNYTDYRLRDYDGIETVLYVEDGKIKEI